MEAGRLVLAKPIPPIPENTQQFPAGAVFFGLEYRVLTNDILDAHLASQGPRVGPRTVDIDTSGVSIHVHGCDGREYLRFDCFEDSPHYHYIYPDAEHQRVVNLDTVAIGDPLNWALGCLRTRLPEMLREAGGSASADLLDHDAMNAALARLEIAANSIRRGASRDGGSSADARSAP